MSKPLLIEKCIATEYFYAILEGYEKQSEIIKRVGLKIIEKTLPNGKKILKRESKTNITEKLNTLTEYKIIIPEGKNKGRKYKVSLKNYFLLMTKQFLPINELNLTFFINENIGYYFCTHVSSFTYDDIRKYNISLVKLFEDFIIQTAITSLKNKKKIRKIKSSDDVFDSFCILCEEYLENITFSGKKKFSQSMILND